MKVYFLFIVFLVIGVSLIFPETIKLEDKMVSFDCDNTLVNISRYGMEIDDTYFSYGALDSSGLFKTLSNPYDSLSLYPSFSTPNKNTKLMGSALKYKEFFIASVLGKRNGIAIGYKGKKLSLFSMFLTKGEDKSIQKEEVLRLDNDTFYCGAEGSLWLLDYCFILSSSKCFYTSLFFSAKIKLEHISLGITEGRVQALSQDGKDWRSSYYLKINNDRAEIRYRIKIGRTPIFEKEFRSLEHSAESEINLGNIILMSSISSLFHEGKESFSLNVGIKGKWWKVEYSYPKGISISFYFDNSTIKLENGKLKTEVILKKETENIEASLKLYGDRFSDYSLSVNF